MTEIVAPAPPCDSMRKRPFMWLGSSAPEAVVQRWCEHALLPAAQNHASQLAVTYFTEENAVGIVDNGNGLPVAPWAHSGSLPIFPFAESQGLVSHPRIEIALTMVPGTYQRHEAMLERWGFVYAIGAIAAAMANCLRIWTVREGVAYTLTMSRGTIVEFLHTGVSPIRAGTAVFFHPDSQIFDPATFDRGALERIVKEVGNAHPDIVATFAVESSCGWWTGE